VAHSHLCLTTHLPPLHSLTHSSVSTVTWHVTSHHLPAQLYGVGESRRGRAGQCTQYRGVSFVPFRKKTPSCLCPTLSSEIQGCFKGAAIGAPKGTLGLPWRTWWTVWTDVGLSMPYPLTPGQQVNIHARVDPSIEARISR